VDHIKPHKGDPTLIYDWDNLQTLCKFHHDSHKQSEEKRGYSVKIGKDGWPEDERHPFWKNKQQKEMKNEKKSE